MTNWKGGQHEKKELPELGQNQERIHHRQRHAERVRKKTRCQLQDTRESLVSRAME